MLCECIMSVSQYSGKIWSNFAAHISKLPQSVAAFVKLLSLLQTSKGALAPSYFLKCLKQTISKAGNPAFDGFTQQDAAEILLYILEELCGGSINASESIRIHIRQTITCTVCQQYTSTETHLLFSSCLFQGRSRCT